MTTPQEVLLKTLKELGDEDFGNFKWFLNQEEVLGDFKSIPKSHLEKANRFTTVSEMVQIYGTTNAIKVTKKVLMKMDKTQLVKKMIGSMEDPADPERDTEQRVQPEDWLRPVLTELINRLSTVNINQLLDRLYQQEIINDQERDDVMEEKTSADKARKLLKEVQKKGPNAVSVLKTALREVNPYLCKTLNLK